MSVEPFVTSEDVGNETGHFYVCALRHFLTGDRLTVAGLNCEFPQARSSAVSPCIRDFQGVNVWGFCEGRSQHRP